MNEHVIRILVEAVVESVVLPAMAAKFGGGVPGALLTAASQRITQIVMEGKAGDYSTLKKLALRAIDEILRGIEGE